MNLLVKAVKHFHTVNKHKWYVFIYSCKAGIPFRGFIHDLSKYSPTEFFESVKYFDGSKSPIHFAKLDKGYSDAWLHHKGRNKHHFEYWNNVDKQSGLKIHPAIAEFTETVLTKISEDGINNTLNSKYLKETYNKIRTRY